MMIQEIEEYIDKKFDFLVTNWGFEKKQLEKHNVYSVTKYRRVDLGVDVKYEYVDSITYTLLVCIRNGIEPENGYMHGGKVVRKHLGLTLLGQKQINKGDVEKRRQIGKKLSKKGLPEKEQEKLLLQSIDKNAELLEKHMPYIMERKDSLFESPPDSHPKGPKKLP
jgi:hypothetical protein